MRPLVVLGVTGSIGRQTLEVAQEFDLEVAAIASARGDSRLLAAAAAWPDAAVAVSSPSDETRAECRDALGSRVAFGPDAVAALAGRPGVTVVNGIVGAAGLAPSLAAVTAGNRLALANKESLVAGGDLLTAASTAAGAEIIPVDSEHSAIWQCLVGEPGFRRVILTASGGPFRGRTRDELGAVTVGDALAHPTWDMGSRITVDSSTLMNKALEVIEAHHLFGADYDRIDVVVHPQSIVHSLVEFEDGSVKAQLGDPDMKLPIQYAITYPGRAGSGDREFDITKQDLTFEPPDLKTFRLLALGYAAGRAGGSAPAVLNAADEIAVAAFLSEEIGYLDIEAVVEHCLEKIPLQPMNTVEQVLEADAAARDEARRMIAKRRSA